MKLFSSEPVWSLVSGLGTVIQAVIVLLAAFGVTLTPVQNLAVNSFGAVLISWLLRARVASVNGTLDGTTIFPAGSVQQNAVNDAKKS